MTQSSHNENGISSPTGHSLRPSRTTYSFATSRLALSSNPLEKPGQHGEDENLMQPSEQHEGPVFDTDGKEAPLKFHKRESASNTELFYDLWFVANLNVFANVHPIINMDNLVSFMCYFILLWITWFVTTVFDARFGNDSVLERIFVAGHLGVMMGFAIAGVSFDQTKLLGPIFKTMALCLMASRIILALQYGLVLFHARKYNRARKPLIFAIALHILPAIAYLISSFYPYQNVSLVWYIIGAGELVVLLVHATFSQTLSFKGTHFNERLNLLTLIIIGEGVIILSKNLNLITSYTWVKDESYAWSSALCGLIACAAAMIYFAFQLYFDWMDHHIHVGAARQALWSLAHLPLHLALVLMAEGSGQCVLWWHAIESTQQNLRQLYDALEDAARSGSSSEVANALNSTTQVILSKYSSTKGTDLNQTFTSIMELPDSLWGSLLARNITTADESYQQLTADWDTIFTTVFNAINDAFKLSVSKEKDSTSPGDMGSKENSLLAESANRLALIFIYLFISAGMVLALLMAMHLVSKHRRWSGFNIFRTSFVFGFGVGLGLLSLLITNMSATENFLLTPWPLPTMTLAYAAILVLTHVPHPPRIFGIFGRRTESTDMETGYTRSSEATSVRFESKPYDPVATGEPGSDGNSSAGYNGGYYTTQTREIQ